MSATIRVGIGGWVYEPWRETFYPPGLPAAQALRYASTRLDAIEVNGTFYSTQRPSTFAAWRDQTPEGFVFALKAPRFATHRRVLADAGESIGAFVASGIGELGDKLGPILWQFAPSKRFDAAEIEAFVRLLPREAHGRPLRHALEPRHDCFRCPEYVELARRLGVATVFTDSDEHPSFADPSGDFVYARLMRTQSAEPQGLPPRLFPALAACARHWRDGGEPAGLPRVLPPLPAGPPRDVFLFFIAGAKERAPAAAMALRRCLAAAQGEPPASPQVA
ncbi:DUF72 domain-containing protein [Rubrivivax gelatinosus]|uniref:Uncharacterized protein YecE (DUF72 family) n=1 Tax=Rubrivivax gelatinosus TaxID=28068 RepID=A0A4R2MC83_RUBGE|nr:DUF72 domain-containing protein [Rubrivivax gelatinosus]MBK1689542.1 hypothetical protein [Rubrivivax gelatinosus]TCP02034.1 uncharacterized protein YecE (DUF72 family) [Rubrivivax gelatinosus]